MKKIIASIILILSLCSIQYTLADDLKLKRGCLKENPVMEGVADQSLINIYNQVCDKKNKDNKSTYLIQAAQRFSALGLNYQAMQLISSLEAQNVSSQGLTDVKFLAGIKLASDALISMREKELRYLNEDVTYPVAKEFTVMIQHSLPSSILVEQAPKVTRPVIATGVKVQSRPTVRPRPVPVVIPKPPKQTLPSAKAVSPFSNL